jgi:hypothetical protein
MKCGFTKESMLREEGKMSSQIDSMDFCFRVLMTINSRSEDGDLFI